MGHPFLRTYGAILPSSLERVSSRPLVSSTNPPVSVSGTGVCLTCLGFSRESDISHFGTVVPRTRASAQDVFAAPPCVERLHE